MTEVTDVILYKYDKYDDYCMWNCRNTTEHIERIVVVFNGTRQEKRTKGDLFHIEDINSEQRRIEYKREFKIWNIRFLFKLIFNKGSIGLIDEKNEANFHEGKYMDKWRTQTQKETLTSYLSKWFSMWPATMG